MLAGPNKGRAAAESGELDKAVRKGKGSLWMGCRVHLCRYWHRRTRERQRRGAAACRGPIGSAELCAPLRHLRCLSNPFVVVVVVCCVRPPPVLQKANNPASKQACLRCIGTTD
eukprot:7742190-Pyramimonas_sp.AAC.1